MFYTVTKKSQKYTRLFFMSIWSSKCGHIYILKRWNYVNYIIMILKYYL